MITFPPFTGHCTLRLRHLLPDESGLYFIFNEREHLLYIGRARNLRERWAGTSHHRYKQLARKGLDQIKVRYVLAPVAELTQLERAYIQEFKPLLNDSQVKEYLPKTSPRFSELQRLLKLASTPLFPSLLYQARDGQVLPREPWDLFRGLAAGVYDETQPHLLIVCRQNMGHLLWSSFSHRTKKRFYTNLNSEYLPTCYFFDARQTIFHFVEIFDVNLAEQVFEILYPNLLTCQVAGVTMKGLLEPRLLRSALEKATLQPYTHTKTRDDLLMLVERLQPLSNPFEVDPDLTW